MRSVELRSIPLSKARSHVVCLAPCFQPGHAEPVLDVYQFDPHEYGGLSSHVLNEIHAQHPDHVLTIKGNFFVGGAHFLIENEKMFIDNNGYANGVVNAHNGIILSAAVA